MAKKKTDAPSQASPADASPRASRLDARTVSVLGLAFISGAALMTLEIVGGRIVAAHLGSHVFVWGAVIGVFMGSLSLGYFLGGKLVDRMPSTLIAGAVTALGGLAVLLVPLIGNPVCRAVAATFFTGSTELSGRWNPLIAVIIIFFAPATVLGAITPITIRLLALETRSLGRLSGRIYALNALGSILGTLVTAFFLMEFLGNSWILTIDGATLFLVGAVVMATFRFGGNLEGGRDKKIGNNLSVQGTQET